MTNAEAVNLKNQMFDGLLFPLVMMDTNRVVAINANLIFGIQNVLTNQAERSDLIRVGKDYGKDVVDRIRKKFEDNKNSKNVRSPDIETMQANIVGYARATGWGKLIWTSEGNIERVQIKIPPTSTMGGSGAGNLFLHGFVAGMTTALRNKEFGVMEDHYNSQTRRLTLTLVEQSQIRPLESQALHEMATLNEKSRVLEEVEKIISSVGGMDAWGSETRRGESRD